MSTGRHRSLIATTLAATLVWLVCAPVAHADSFGSWAGRVYQSDRVTPREGVVISLVDDDRSFRSEPTRADGAFMLDAVPAGTYGLRVETPEGVFVSAQSLEVHDGTNKPMALALNTLPGNAELEHGLGGEPSRTTEIIVAGVVFLFALFIILELTDDASEKRASVT